MQFKQPLAPDAEYNVSKFHFPKTISKAKEIHNLEGLKIKQWERSKHNTVPY